MITARYEPPLLFQRERSPSPHLGTSRRGCTPPPSSSSSLTDGEDIDRFMELAHAALEEATKEEDAKGILQELVERVLVKTGAPLLAGVIAEQWRSQEVIEQLAERSFERQRRRQQRSPLSSPAVSLSANKKKRRTRPASDSPKNEKNQMTSTIPLRPSSSPVQQSRPSSLFSSTSSSSSSFCSSSSVSLSSQSQTSVEATLKDPHDPDSMDEAVTRDQFIVQQSSSLHTEPDRLLLVSEYIWRLFRLLILASLVALVYHYVCTYPHQLFLVV